MNHLIVATGHNQLHHILQVELHFLERYFHFEVFDVPVGLFDELLKLRFTAGVFFEELAVFLVRFHQGLPDIVRRNRHSFPPGWCQRSHNRNNYHNEMWKPIGKMYRCELQGTHALGDKRAAAPAI
jgi:hypothetical protein